MGDLLRDAELYALLTDPENQPHQFSRWLTVDGDWLTCCCGTPFNMLWVGLGNFVLEHSCCYKEDINETV